MNQNLPCLKAVEGFLRSSLEVDPVSLNWCHLLNADKKPLYEFINNLFAH